MVARQCAKCSVCGAITLLRIQMPLWFEEQPIAVGCKGCGGRIRGTLKVGPPPKAELRLENATVVDEPSDGSIVREIECVGEFPATKHPDEAAGAPKITPFIAATSAMGMDAMEEYRQHVHAFYGFWKEKREKWATIHDLLVAGNHTLALQQMDAHFPHSKDPGLDAYTALHRYFEITGVYCGLLLPDAVQPMKDPAIGYLAGIFRRHEAKFPALLRYAFDEYKLTDATFEGFALLGRFMQMFHQFLPVIALTYYPNYSPAASYGTTQVITTATFETVKGLYADSFEWLSRALVPLMAAANLDERGDINSMPAPTSPTRQQVNDLNAFKFLAHGAKARFINTSQFLSSYWSGLLDAELRNGLNHYKAKFDPVTQVITYYPYNDSQRADTSKTIFLIDFVHYAYRHVQKLYSMLYVLGVLRTIRERTGSS